MEVRRNLEGVYKRRFEESQKVNYQLELQLQIVKVYARMAQHIVPQTDVNSVILERYQQLETLLKEIQNLHQQTAVTSNGLDLEALEECESLSKMEIERVRFQAVPVTMFYVFSFLHSTVKVGYGPNVTSNATILTDGDSLQKIIVGVSLLLATSALDVTYNMQTRRLYIEFSEHGKPLDMKTAFDQVEQLMDAGAQPPIDETLAYLYTCSALAQSLGGELLSNEASDKVTLQVPCDIVLNPEGPNIPAATRASVLAPTQPEQSQPHQPMVPQAPSTPPPATTAAEDVVTAPLNDALGQVPTMQHKIRDADRLSDSSSPSSSPRPSANYDALKGRSLNILLVEDNPVLQGIFKRWWSKIGHNVFVASNGQEAVDMFKAQNFSIIFSDIETPIKDGLTAAREIRAYEAERHRTATPIIGLSGHSQMGYAQKALQNGMDDFIVKSTGFPFQKIFDTVVRFCG